VTAGAASASAIAGASFLLPALGFALGPVFARPAVTWQEVGPLSRFTDTTYVPVTITIEPGIGEAGLSTAFVRRHVEAIDGPPKDRYDEIVAISSRCAHVGCPVRYTAAARAFICPCHGGVYDFRGLRIGGPPPRPLDRFYTLVQNGTVLIGPRYSVNSELRRFAPRDPGEPLDGIGRLLYPARFSTPPPPPGAAR
jgi:Rieske Fe-S protein